MKRIPPYVEPVTTDNLEERLREWFLSFSLAIKIDHDSESYFKYTVTTPGGAIISVFRKKNVYSDYLTFQAGIVLTEDEKKILGFMTELEKTHALERLKLELARFRVGYYSENFSDRFFVSRQLPITHSLSATVVIGMVWEIEAVVRAALGVNALTANAFNQIRAKESSTPVAIASFGPGSTP